MRFVHSHRSSCKRDKLYERSLDFDDDFQPRIREVGRTTPFGLGCTEVDPRATRASEHTCTIFGEDRETWSPRSFPMTVLRHEKTKMGMRDNLHVETIDIHRLFCRSLFVITFSRYTRWHACFWGVFCTQTQDAINCTTFAAMTFSVLPSKSRTFIRTPARSNSRFCSLLHQWSEIAMSCSTPSPLISLVLDFFRSFDRLVGFRAPCFRGPIPF